MKSFAEFTQAQPKPNLHMSHLDESIFEGGSAAAEDAIDALLSLIEGDGQYDLTVKWDGSPSLFCGNDPADGQFFVGTKSVFNANPKLYKTNEAIDANEPAGKATKLKESLRLLAKLNIPEGVVLQGDLLWTQGDHKYLTFENTRYVTVHPNTLIYGWVAESDIGHRVRNAELGIVFHTQYTGNGALSSYTPTYGVDVSKLNSIPEVYVDDAYFKGKQVQVDPSVAHNIRESVLQAREAIDEADQLVSIMNNIPKSAIGAKIQTYYNTCIREGYYPSADDYDQYVTYLKNYWMGRVVESVKTEKAKDSKMTQLKQLLDDMRLKERVFHNAFYYTQKINEAKTQIIEILNQASAQKVFVNYDDVILEANHEGYCVINRDTNVSHKLVDRVTFSHNNFSETVKKGW